ncbi:unnamed protein product [Caenorhabditis bovis]|uniref:G-protein coupled receptors family 1 profile domain-containing protein n=1 Tax=Caenorhabditis bovis TaxID=2654633 RepID=A0A8S1E7D7_9PELO|nr:unnamed protein product [Caenorhabditis bovis]
MYQKLSQLITAVETVMCLVGIVTNFLALIIYTRPNFRKKSINVLLSALSAADLGVCLLAIPVFASKQFEAWISVYLVAVIMVYLYPISIMFQSMSVWLLVSITIDRYLAVCHPFMVNTYCSRNRAIVIVIFVVIFSIAYNFVRFWEYYIDFSKATEGLEGMVQPLLRADEIFMLWYQNVLTLLSQFLLPLVVLCGLNLQVARTILRASEQRRELVASVKREHSTAKMMIMVVIVFVFCYTFSFVLNISEIQNADLFQSEMGYLLNDINNVLVVVNSSSTFIFYYNFSTRFRNQARSLYGIRWFMSRTKFTVCNNNNPVSRSETTKFKESYVSAKQSSKKYLICRLDRRHSQQNTAKATLSCDI